MRLRTLLIISALLTVCAIAHADTYEYDIVLDGRAAVFYEPEILTTLTTIDASSFHPGSNPTFEYIDINPTAGSCPFVSGGVPFNGCIDAYFSDPQIGEALFLDGPLTSLNFVYQDEAGNRVVITDTTPPPSPTPEPSSLALLGTGLVGVAAFARRRLARTSNLPTPELGAS